MSTAAADYDDYSHDGYGGDVDDEPDGLPRGLHPFLAELLDGPAVDAMYGLRSITDTEAGQVPAAVAVHAVLAAQRLASWAKAQQHRWTAALARPGVAVPVTDLL